MHATEPSCLYQAALFREGQLVSKPTYSHFFVATKILIYEQIQKLLRTSLSPNIGLGYDLVSLSDIN